jgi:L-seryl-tRNA(Ser) seleniumtransferase
MSVDHEMALRALPSVNALLARPRLARLAERHGRAPILAAAQGALEELRAELRAGPPSRDREDLLARAETIVVRRAREARRTTLSRVVNATGVVIHTNLGRAPLARAAASAAARAGRGYVALEYDVARGERGSRYVHCERLLCELTGAEAALVVNNCAAALLLALNTAAEGRDVLVSRGEMIEIGGGFRVHEILAKSGARLVEVGATNKTHASDYERALDRATGSVGAILKVHRSNFVQTGFVAEVELRQLADLLRRRSVQRGDGEADGTGDARSDVALVFDLGSGCLTGVHLFGLPHEPTPTEALAQGADLVAFSGDKLLGGPQAGVLLGRRDWVARARSNPLTRALRVDKLTLAALEATLRLHLSGRLDEIPVLELLGRPLSELRAAAARLQAELATVSGLEAEVVETETRVGGGSLPGAALPGAGVALRQAGLAAGEVEGLLRAGSPPVIARIVDDRVVLDLRSVRPQELSRLGRLVRRALSRTPAHGMAADVSPADAAIPDSSTLSRS